MRRALPIALAAVLVAIQIALTVVAVAVLGFYDPTSDGPLWLIPITAALWAVFALAIVALRRVRGRAAVVLVLVGSLGLGVAAMSGPPNQSTDSARYAWDGIVQAAGYSPYDYVPADPVLEPLRTDWLFPEPRLDAEGEPRCDGPRFMRFREVGTDEVICSAINRAPVPTIYPPLAEMIFAGVRVIVGPDAQYWPIQLVGLLGSLAVTGVLLQALRRSGRDPRWAALWGWCPLVANEAVTNSHIDIVGALLLVAATLAVARGRSWLGGVALGAAIGAKLIPVIGTPALLGRRPIPIVVGATATFLLLYVPYVIASGIEVLGYLPGYLSEEGYESGKRFVLFSPWLPGISATVVVAVLLLVTALYVWRRTDPASPWMGQLVMIGVTLVVVSPRYPWYALLLVPMVVMTARWEWLAIPLALATRPLMPGTTVVTVALIAAIALIAVVTWRRAGPSGRADARNLLVHPVRSLKFADRKITAR